MIDEVRRDAEHRMDRSVQGLHEELKKLRAGRAHPGLLDHVTVPYYGTPTPLRQLAGVSAEDARTLLVTPYDRSAVAAVEKALRECDLGLNPVGAGQVLRVPLPALTEQRRRDLTRVVRSEGENCRVAVRNVRRDALHTLKEALKEKLISSDDEARASAEIQKLTDRHIAEIETTVQAKEAELLEI